MVGVQPFLIIFGTLRGGKVSRRRILLPPFFYLRGESDACLGPVLNVMFCM